MAQVEVTMQDVAAEAEAGAAEVAGAAAAVAVDAAGTAEMPARPADHVTRIAAASAADATPGAGDSTNECSATTKPRFASITDAEAQELLATRNSGVKPMLNRYGYRFVKRAFDIVASGCAIALLFVPSLVLCAVICIKSPGAGPIYGQTRVGRVKRDGGFSTFRLYKFRSMVPDADERLCALRDKNEADGPLFKIKEDPRVIPGVGKFIRKHSIDELPQLINVFCGKMTLIGPRPGLRREAVQYDERAMQRLTVKPGCGGAWQAGDRSDATFDEMIGMDLMYVKHCSVKYDLQLIFGTLKAMIVGEGAY